MWQQVTARLPLVRGMELFYGSSASWSIMTWTTPKRTDTSPQPVAVLGEFNANFTDGTTAGAYGANKQ